MDRFTDYITYDEEYRPDIQALTFPPLSQLKPLILYGPAGVGKYTQMLQIIKPYSPSQLKVEKRLTINTTSTFYIKMSDIHYEVDMDLLVCNAKVLWDDIFQHVHEIIQNKYTEKQGIIVCKNFHKINRELLDIFYSYMQSSIHFILLTESISFLPDTILTKCKVLSIPRTRPFTTNLKSMKDTPKPFQTILSHLYSTDMSQIREDLYSILIFDMGVEEFVYTLLSLPANDTQRKEMIKECITFLQYYNNNYRPIYHLECFFYSIQLILQT